MKAILLFSALVALPLSIVGQQLDNSPKGYSYFVRGAKFTDNNQTKIVINDKGDTTLVAYYNPQDVTNQTSQQLSKVFKGTPFFKNGWYKGTISSDRGKDMSFLMAYNIQKGLVYIVENSKNDAVAIRPEEFTIEGHTFRKYENVFLETLYMKKTILLKGYNCTLSSSHADKTGYGAQGGDFAYEGEFSKTHKYFTIQDDMLLVVPSGKKALQTFPKEKRASLEQFVKNNKINLKSENGLIEVFRYYDSL